MKRRSGIDVLPWTVTMDGERRAVEDVRRLRIAVAVAVLFMASALAIQLPTDSPRTAEKQMRSEVLLLQPTPRLRRATAEPVAATRPQRARRVPVPAPPIDLVFEANSVAAPIEVAVGLYVPSQSLFGVPDFPPAAPSGEPIRVGGEVRAPRRISGPDPVIPPTAARIPGTHLVVLDAVIDHEGFVQEITVVKSAPLGLDRAAVAAVRRWRFEPATLHGRPVAVRYHLTVNYRVDR